jgi:uncharacterized protein YPO0396
MPTVVVTGARQTGKSTLAQAIVPAKLSLGRLTNSRTADENISVRSLGRLTLGISGGSPRHPLRLLGRIIETAPLPAVHSRVGYHG